MATNRSAPTASIVPILVYADVEAAINWLCNTVGFTERLRVPTPGGQISHAQLNYGNGSVMIGRQGEQFRVPTRDGVSHVVHVTVENVDQHYTMAKHAGAHIVREPATMPFGERQYTAADPEGHWWTFSQHVADVALEAWGARAPKTLNGPNDR